MPSGVYPRRYHQVSDAAILESLLGDCLKRLAELEKLPSRVEKLEDQVRRDHNVLEHSEAKVRYDIDQPYEFRLKPGPKPKAKSNV